MPTGIVMSSSSVGASQEAIEKVLTANGYEPDKPEAKEPEAPVEPKRDDFESDEDFEAAQTEFETKQEEAEEAAEAEREAEEEKKKPKLTRSQRIAARATRELQEKNRRLEERLAALEGKGGEKKPAAVKEPEKPKRDAFKSDEEFDDALFEWRYKVRRAKEQAAETQNVQQKRLEDNYKNYQSNVAEFKDEHDDWDDVIKDSEIPIQEGVYFAIHELENGPAVVYHLGKHPAVAQKLYDMSPFAAVMEVGRLAARLKTGASTEPDAAASRTKPKTKPRLPEPVKPVSTAATSSTLTSKEAAKQRNFRAFKVAQARGV